MTQPTALFLADILEDGGKPADIAEKAAAELRRLHAELERCKQVCAATSEAWREEAALAEPVQDVKGCDVCEHPLYAGIKCRVCGRVTQAEPVQEPVANDDKVICPACCHQFRAIPPNVQQMMLDAGFEPPFTTPPQRKPLTEEEIWRTYKNLWMFHPAEEPRLAGDVLKFARAVERAHGIT